MLLLLRLQFVLLLRRILKTGREDVGGILGSGGRVGADDGSLRRALVDGGRPRQVAELTSEHFHAQADKN